MARRCEASVHTCETQHAAPCRTDRLPDGIGHHHVSPPRIGVQQPTVGTGQAPPCALHRPTHTTPTGRSASPSARAEHRSDAPSTPDTDSGVCSTRSRRRTAHRHTPASALGGPCTPGAARWPERLGGRQSPRREGGRYVYSGPPRETPPGRLHGPQGACLGPGRPAAGASSGPPGCAPSGHPRTAPPQSPRTRHRPRPPGPPGRPSSPARGSNGTARRPPPPRAASGTAAGSPPPPAGRSPAGPRCASGGSRRPAGRR
jgi:hypothetical protein